MKINNAITTTYQTKSSKNLPTTEQKTTMDTSKKKFDAIEIHSTPQDIEEKKFIGEITTKLRQEIRVETPASRLEELKKQIQDGTYKINASEIASNMLSLDKENNIE